MSIQEDEFVFDNPGIIVYLLGWIRQIHIVRYSAGQEMLYLKLINDMGEKEEMVINKRFLRDKKINATCEHCLELHLRMQ